MTRLVFVLQVLLATWILNGCFGGDKVSGSSSTGNAEPKVIASKLIYEDGEPAAGAKVSIRPADTLADTTGIGLAKVAAVDTFSTTTDDTGAYSVDTGVLDPGTYVIEGDDGDGNLVLIDSVVVEDASSTVEVPEDTLKPAGALKGVIRLSEGGDARKIFVLAFGIDRFAGVNEDGSFKFENLAEANYDLRIISTLDNYGVLDTNGISVVSADTTDLDTLELPFVGIPTPKNLKVSYDTLVQVVTITWDAADPELITGYHVYRKPSSSEEYALAVDSLLADTTFVDGLASGLEKGESYDYMIRAVDSDDNEGLNSVAINAVVLFFVDAGKDSMYEIGDSVVFKGLVDTDLITPTEYRWDVNGDGADELVSADTDSLVHAFDSIGVYAAVFSVDDGNRVYTDTTTITITEKDTSGAPTAPRNLALAYDTLKQIVTLTWSPNLEGDVKGYNVYRKDTTADFVKINTTLITDTVYMDSSVLQDGTYEYKITAVDNGDGEGDKNIGISFNFTNRLKLATNTPAFGERQNHTSVVFNNKMWVIGGNGPNNARSNDVWSSNDGINWVAENSSADFPQRSHHASVIHDGKMWVIGGYDGDVKNDVWNSSDGQTWVQATDSANFLPRMAHTCVVFDNKIWVIGGSSLSGRMNDVWSSFDGISWTQATDSAEFSKRNGHQAVSFKDKLWVIGGEEDSGNKLSDVWSSTDGVSWSQSSVSGGFPGRNSFTSIASISSDSTIWIFGGFVTENSSSVISNEIWYSEDGENWGKLNPPSDFSGRFGNTSLEFENKIWVIGQVGQSNQSEVWYLE